MKDLLNELHDELVKLHSTDDFATLPVELARSRTIDAFSKVIARHKLTGEEKKSFITAVAAMDGDITLDEAQLIQAVGEAE